MRKVLPVLAAGLVVAGVIAGEALCRVLNIPPRSNQVGHSVLNHTWRPSTSFVHREFANRGISPYTHTYNSQGWLETHDINRSKPPGTFRIFYLGDSYTEGTCSMEQSVPRRVESALRPYFGQKHLSLEVVNTGTSSYAPSLYYLVLKQILAFEPDLIVINVDLTDVFDDSLYRTSAQFDAAGDLIAVPPEGSLTNKFIRNAQGLRQLSLIERALNVVRRHSNLANLIFMLKTAERLPAPTSAISDLFAWCRPQWDSAIHANVEYSQEMLRRTFALAAKHQIKIALTLVPHLEQFQGRFSLLPNEAIQKLAAETGTPYLDSWGGLRAKLGGKDPAGWYIRGDMHFNPAGYQAWAEAQVEFLLDPENDLLPRLYRSPCR